MYNGYNVKFANDRFGNPNSAIRFTQGYYQIPPWVYFNGDFTVSVWIKAINTINLETIIDFGNIGSDNVQLKTSLGSDYNYNSYSFNNIYTVKPKFYVYARNSYSIIETSNRLTIGQWTHLVLTFNENVGSVYMNGLLIGQTNDMFTPRNINRTSNYIGRSNQNNNDVYLRADLDDFRIYNKSLSQAEVNSLFLQQVKTGSNLLG